MDFTCKPSEIQICCLSLCWALLLAQDAAVTDSSAPSANLLKHHAMCFSFVTACAFPVICFWPLMQDKCMQSFLFSCFYSKDSVEVRVCLLAAFVCVSLCDLE